MLNRKDKIKQYSGQSKEKQFHIGEKAKEKKRKKESLGKAMKKVKNTLPQSP